MLFGLYAVIQLPLMVELRELGVELGMHVSEALFASFLL